VWREPLVLLALGSVAAPILIHILVQRRAERFAFPTLRFIAPTRLAAIRRHLLEDAALLAVRIAILIVTIAALAGPLIVTAARRRAWDQQIVRAVVTDTAGTAAGTELVPPAKVDQGRSLHPDEGRPLRLEAQKYVDAASLKDGIRRAIAWLDTAPPGRRELVIRSPFPIGSLTAADIAEIPSAVGIRFERQGTLPPTRTVPGNVVLTSDGSFRQTVTLDGVRTLVTDTAAAGAIDWPIVLSSAETDRPMLDAAVAAVRDERVWAPSPNHRARFVVIDAAATASPALAAASAIQQPWMAEAIVRIVRDRDLQSAATAVGAGSSDPRFSAAPWQTLVSAGDGRPLILAAAADAQLLVVSAAAAKELITPVLLRTVANAVAEPADLQRAEVVPIPEQVLRGWARDAGPVAAPRLDTIVDDGRRWFWLSALLLLALETWMRRSRTSVAIQAEEQSRVA
jgi:hypothetical protein